MLAGIMSEWEVTTTVKISELFDLKKSQYELDFVDINPDIDTPLFLDPYYISKCEFPFAVCAYESLRSYFEFLLALLKGKRIEQARELFSHLGESNDVCMGMSHGKPQGRGMGPEDTNAIFKELLRSRAIHSGIMEDIEDFRIFVPNVDRDKVSDMTANIIKLQLLEYTKQQCELHNIPLLQTVPSGMYWDAKHKRWDNQYTERLVINNKPILLVPKRIVSFTDKYTTQEYKQHFVLNYLQNEHLSLGSSLVRKYKNGEKYVTKKSIEEIDPPIDKEYLARFTESHPEVFQDFKNKTVSKIERIPGAVLEDLNANEICNYLISKLRSVPSGTKNASNYHNLIIGILELLFYPNLSSPKKEKEIHEGRKRIDIVFNNSAEDGFFYTTPSHNVTLPCPYVYVECKNYTGEVANPEIDQLSGRFSNMRGRVGILTCRVLEENFIKRCADTFADERGLVIPLEDSDLIKALKDYPNMGVDAIENILASKYEQIVFEK